MVWSQETSNHSRYFHQAQQLQQLGAIQDILHELVALERQVKGWTMEGLAVEIEHGLSATLVDLERGFSGPEWLRVIP